MSTPLILAEVSDKMNTWPELGAWMVFISAAGIVALRRRSWWAVVPGLFSALWAWSAYDILADRFMRQAVIAELGLHYILLQFFPLTVFAIFALLELRKSRTSPHSQLRAADAARSG